MEKDPYTNEVIYSRPSESSASMSQSAPYKRLIEEQLYEIGSGHKARIGDYVDIMDNIIRTTGAGSHYGRYQDVYYGLNRLPQMPELPMHKETQGLVLLTRPDLNLAYNNIARVRQLSHLLTQDTLTGMNAVKLALDPTTQRGRPITGRTYGLPVGNRIISKLTDINNPYLVLLSNAIKTMSPPPDIGINVYTTPEGNMKEQWMMNDSIAEYNGYYDISMTLNNIKGNTVLMSFLTWVLYMGYLRVGPIVPHGHNRIRNRMDYFTRIERYKLDESGRFVEQWFHTGASIPKSISVGAPFALDRLLQTEHANAELTVQFGCVGATYNDPIQLWEFNKRMIRWNPGLGDQYRKTLYFKVPSSDLALTNYYGYPLINLLTRELEWWVLIEDYRKLSKGLFNVENKLAELDNYTKGHLGGYTPAQAANLTPR